MGNIVDRGYPSKPKTCLRYVVHTQTGVYTSNRVICDNQVLCVKLVPRFSVNEYIPDYWTVQIHQFTTNKKSNVIFSEKVETLSKAKIFSRKKLIELGVVFQNVVRSSSLKRKVLF